MDKATTKPPLQKTVLKWLLIGLSGISGLYFLLCLFLVVWQKRIIFNPTRTLEKFPEDYQLQHLEVRLPVTKRDEIHGYWFLSQENSNGKALLFLHGNSYNVGENLFHAKRFVDMGFYVLLMDYRGFGRSDGTFPSERFTYEDAQAMYEYIREEQGFAPENIFVYGHSLGGAIAINLVKDNPVAGLIAEGTFTSMSDMATYAEQYSFLPVDLLLHQRFESLSKIPDITTPTLIIHGLEDDTIPYAMGQQLYDAAIAPKQIYLVPEAGHNDVASTADLAYNEAILDFVKFARSPDLEAVSP